MYLGWIDYAVLALLLSKPNYLYRNNYLSNMSIGLSAGIGIYQGCIRSKQLSAREFLVADGRMAVRHLQYEFLSIFSYRFCQQQ